MWKLQTDTRLVDLLLQHSDSCVFDSSHKHRIGQVCKKIQISLKVLSLWLPNGENVLRFTNNFYCTLKMYLILLLGYEEGDGGRCVYFKLYFLKRFRY